MSSFLCEKVEGTPRRCMVGLPGTVRREEWVKEARGKERWVIGWSGTYGEVERTELRERDLGRRLGCVVQDGGKNAWLKILS